ncbi:CPXCG motif-containing cysteine-rich protein [Zhouia spongiae]|uniref:CPXCG motif-containing cysteine-rich protein n=1 Tax=Zhouia spongiae TaxID=2202721 RepID=A0ABY3YRB7_9FLAO|nr:CPXCG motif-containing cysteine-rich protein [Zhouia spongiae]UNZ00196.1 CPXCG motif-containing cysteine-rich protein [Zhouia spongiae]
MIEHFFQCPYCWEQVSVLVDTSIPEQSYIEDCEVCCNPVRLNVSCQYDKIIVFEALNTEQ